MKFLLVILAIFCLTGLNAQQNNGRCNCTDASATSCETIRWALTGQNMFSCHYQGPGSGNPCSCDPFTSPTMTVTFNTGCTGVSNKLKMEVAGSNINWDAVDTVTLEFNDGSTADVVDTSAPYSAVYTPLNNAVIFNGTARLELADGFSYTITDNIGNTLTSTSSDIDTTAVEGCTQQIATEANYNSADPNNIMFYPLPVPGVTQAHLTLVSGGGNGGGGGGGGYYVNNGVGQKGGGGASGGEVVYNISNPSGLTNRWRVYLGNVINYGSDFTYFPSYNGGNGEGGSRAWAFNNNGVSGKSGRTGFAEVGFDSIISCTAGGVPPIDDDDLSSCFNVVLTGGGPGLEGKGGVNGPVPTFANGGVSAYIQYNSRPIVWTFDLDEISFTGSNLGADGVNRVSGGTGGAATYSDASGNNAGVMGGDGGRG